MLKRLLVLGFAFILLLFSESIKADQEQLNKLVEQALKNYPELKASQLSEKAYLHQSKAAGALPDPAVSIGVLNLPVSSLSLSETPMSGVQFGISQKIPWFGKLSDKTEIAKLHYEMSQVDSRNIENRIVKEVSSAYYNYSYWIKVKILLEENINLLRATLKIVENKYENGEAAAQNVLHTKSMISRLEVKLLNIEQMVESSIIKLNFLTGDSLNQNQLDTYLPEVSNETTNAISIYENPLLKKSELNVKQSLIKRDLARKNYYPDFNVGIDYRFRKEIMGDPVRGEDFLSFKVGFNLPFSFFSRKKDEVKSASFQSEATKEQQRFIEEKLTSKLNDNLSSLETYKSSISHYDKSIIPETNASKESAEVAYEVGKIDFNALLSAYTDLLDAQVERLTLLRQYNLVKADLIEISGNSFERIN